MYYPRFSFKPKIGKAFPQIGVLFVLWVLKLRTSKHSGYFKILPEFRGSLKVFE